MGAYVTEADSRPRLCVSLGPRILDLQGVFRDEDLAEPTLNAFLSGGPQRWRAFRSELLEILDSDAQSPRLEANLLDADSVEMRLAFEVGDYVDFYCSLEHASNLGRIFRPGSDPLQPNWRYLPVGYHGRSGTIVVSGTPIRRPWGQRRLADGGVATGPSLRLDIEAELGFVVGVGSSLGDRVATRDFAQHVFGVVLVNDWSARDIQAWEYVPLGPFLGKSFATSVSPWVVPLESLASARVAGPKQDPEPFDYLKRWEDWGLDLTLEVQLNGEVISRPPARSLYWTPDQMLAHMTSNGASLRCGDLFATGTLSGSGEGELGSLIELTWNAERPISMKDGQTRTFLEDGDEIVIAASAPGSNGETLSLGAVVGRILPCPVEGGE
jgi:fumarylacetoacetase